MALAGKTLESRLITHGESTARSLDGSRLGESCHGFGDRLATHAKQIRELFVREIEQLGSRDIDGE